MSNLTQHLKEIKVSIDTLHLDPNNPRLFDRPSIVKIGDEHIVTAHKELLNRFSNADNSKLGSEDGGLNLISLKKSIKEIGFVNIDSIVVRPIDGEKNKYVVLEGNRRLAAMLLIRRTNPPKEVSESIENIKVFCINKEELAPNLYQELENMVLGIRHHSPMLQWNFHPRAINISKEYEKLKVSSAGGLSDNKLKEKLASVLSISKGDVDKALKTLSAYRQFSDGDLAVKPKHFSLIESVVSNRTILKEYLDIESTKNIEFEAAALVNIDKLCQFSKRDERDFADKKILKDPKSAKNFAKLLNARNHRKERVRAEASHSLQYLFQEDLDEGEIAITLEEALQNHNRAVRVAEWKELLSKLLDSVGKEGSKLEYDKFKNEGRDLQAKEKLEFIMARYRSQYLGASK